MSGPSEGGQGREGRAGRGRGRGRGPGRGRGRGRGRGKSTPGCSSEENERPRHQKKQRPPTSDGNHPLRTKTSSVQIADSIKALSAQMQLINGTIESALSAQAELQSRADAMNTTLTALQTHANAVNQSLETLLSQVDLAAVDDAPRLVTPMAAQDGRQSPEQAMSNDEAPVVNAKSAPAKENSKRGETPGSSKGSHESIAALGYGSNEGAASGKVTLARNIGTLDDLIMSCAPYLTGSPEEYITWLRNDLEVNTIAELSETLTKCPELLESGNGSVGIRQKREFGKAVLASTAMASAKDTATASTGNQLSSGEDGKGSFQRSVRSGGASPVPGSAGAGRAEASPEGRAAYSPTFGGRRPRDILLAFYQTHNPEVDMSDPARSKAIDEMLFQHAGKEEELFCRLAEKYGVNPSAFGVGAGESAVPAPQMSIIPHQKGGAARNAESTVFEGNQPTASERVARPTSLSRPAAAKKVGDGTHATNKAKDVKTAGAETGSPSSLKVASKAVVVSLGAAMGTSASPTAAKKPFALKASMPGEEIAKKQRTKAKQRKAEELARQEEEEKADADADKKRRAEAKLEKRAALARHDAEVQTHQKIESPVTLPSTKPFGQQSAPEKPALLSGSSLTAISRQMAKKGNRPSMATKKKQHASKPVAVDRLSSYIKSKPKEHQKRVTPAFALIQNEKTVKEGRKLMRLEVETQTCKDELAVLHGRKVQLEKGIKAEQNLIDANQAEIEELEKKVRSKWKIMNLSIFSGNVLEDKLDAMDAEEEARLAKEEKERARRREKAAKKRAAKKRAKKEMYAKAEEEAKAANDDSSVRSDAAAPGVEEVTCRSDDEKAANDDSSVASDSSVSAADVDEVTGRSDDEKAANDDSSIGSDSFVSAAEVVRQSSGEKDDGDSVEGGVDDNEGGGDVRADVVGEDGANEDDNTWKEGGASNMKEDGDGKEAPNEASGEGKAGVDGEEGATGGESNEKGAIGQKSADDPDKPVTEKKDPPTLSELIDSCSEFLSGDPAKYVEWLLSVKIKTITDLGAEVIDDLDRLIKGGGDVGISPGSEQSFSSTVFDAVSGRSTLNDADIETPEDREKRLQAIDMEEKAAIARKMVAEVEHKAMKKRKGYRYNEVKEAKSKIEWLKKSSARAKKSMAEQKRRLEEVTPPFGPKTKQLQQLRSEIAEIKGGGMEEDVNFSINRSRDERGFTFLMVAAQNDDFFTAKLCFELSASPHARSPEGLTAVDYSSFFGFEQVTNLICKHGGRISEAQSGAWGALQAMVPQSKESSKSWDDTLLTAETAALPAESLMESPEACEEDDDKRMPILSPNERRSTDFTCFESRLLDTNINPNQVRRVVLLDKTVYHWSLSADLTSRRNFVDVLEGLKPAVVRKEGVNETNVHRRAVVGAATTYEILAARFEDGSSEEKAVLFTPFVSGEVDGTTSIGVLVWAVVPESHASLYKTLVANVEFMRYKVKLDDRFLGHKEAVLELGKDMHLLDLQSTSIWTTSAMELFILNVDDGDLERIHNPGFSAKKRVVYSEEQVNKKIFRSTKAEARQDEDILAGERLDKSSHIAGGAGTGKTLLMIKKVSREETSRRVLVVSRLPRLVSIIKSAVEENRGDEGVENIHFTTYDDLVQLLSRRVVPDDDSEFMSFIQFERIRYDCDESNISFHQKFVTGHLNDSERKQMANNLIDPLTLWHAIVVIKSSAKCADTKEPLALEEYLALPLSFGLTEGQRRLCYKLFLVYEEWRKSENYWDEMDRILYILQWGPSVFRDECYKSWTERVNRFGEQDLLGDEGEPLYPFFFDVVCADEAQDFVETELLLFAKMSSSVRGLFLSADPAQSVELGVKMREGTVNDVFHNLTKDEKHWNVKDVLQLIQLRTNHRTHAQNLAIGQAIRRILARSFKVPLSEETALINGMLPKTIHIAEVSALADAGTFKGGNVVFIAPDEIVPALRSRFNKLGIKNDLFGVREAKGLEFDACALIGFFGYIEDRGSTEEWLNCLRWLSSQSTLANSDSTGEIVSGVMLADCDYRLSAPNVSDEAMLLYTALTRSRRILYLIEVEETLKEDKSERAHHGKRAKKKGAGLVSFAFRTFEDLGLAKRVHTIDEGSVEMSAAQHKARGVLYVTQALNMSRNHEPIEAIKETMERAMFRFRPNQGNDSDLLDKTEKHLAAIVQKHNLFRYARENFLVKGESTYNLEGRFAEVLQFEQRASRFFSRYLCDSFLAEEVHDVRQLLEEIIRGTPYESHFQGACATIRRLEQAI